MARPALIMAVMVVGMLAMVQQTMQLKVTLPIPIFESHDRLSSRTPIGPFFGLILSSNDNEMALNKSDLWKPSYYVDMAGRRFRVGMLNGVDVVAVIGGSLSAQASVTTQIMLDHFRIRGIIQLGSSLTIDDRALSVGSVSVVKSAAFTGLWTWEPQRERLSKPVPQLSFGEYGYPNPGMNHLGRINYEKVNVFEPQYTPSPKQVFFHEVDAELYDAATHLEVDLKQCYDSSHCLPKKPELVVGLKASTSDINIENAFYAKFLHNNFRVSTADTQSATVIMTAKANGTPVIVFRAASRSLDKAPDSGFSYLASENVMTVAAKYLEMFPVPRADVQSY